MKWKNIDIGAGYYYMTGTITEWLPVLRRDDIRNAVCHEINVALRRFGASLIAHVIMPEHLHLLVHLPEAGQLHRFIKCWRGRSARRIIDMLVRQGDSDALAVLARHANGRSRYAAWKEQARALPIITDAILEQKTTYIHNNPVRRELVEEPGEWPYSSFGCYESGIPVSLPDPDVSGFRIDPNPAGCANVKSRNIGVCEAAMGRC